jgi:hypothetical protein
VCPLILVESLREDDPFTAAEFATEVRWRAQGNKAFAPRQCVDEFRRPGRAKPDAIHTKEADLLTSASANDGTHLVAEVAVETRNVEVVLSACVA